MKLLHSVALAPIHHDGVFFAAALLFGFLFVFLYLRYRSLKHIPGPLLASLTDLWLFSRVWRGMGYRDICRDLHAQYGPVVRIGPKRVYFAQPEATSTIYGSTKPFMKVPAITDRISLFSLIGYTGCILRSDPCPCERPRGSLASFHQRRSASQCH